MQLFKQFIFILILAIPFANLNAQDSDSTSTEEKPWTMGGSGGLTFSQVGLFNWQGGGASNITLLGNLNGFANYKKGSITWDNTLDLGYGFLWNDIFKPDSVRAFSKTDDKIDLLSRFGKKAFAEKLYYSGFFQFQSQFTKGYTSPTVPDYQYISNLLSPGYIKAGIGMDYKPNDAFYISLSPLAAKITIVMDDSLANIQAFGVNVHRVDDTTSFTVGNSKNVRAELGASFRAGWKKDIMKNVTLDTKLEVFLNYLQDAKTSGIPFHADFNWQTAIVAQVNKYLGVKLMLDLLYDGDIYMNLAKPNGEIIDEDSDGIQDVGRRLQIREIFGVSLVYTFNSKEKK